MSKDQEAIDAPTERPGTKQIRAVLASCVMGTTVEWYDFFLYGVAAAIAPILVFPMLHTGNAVVFGLGIVLALGVLYPLMYGPEGAFFAGLFPVHVRYTGISAVYQMSGIVASGLTPMILTWLLDRADGGTRLLIGYFVLTGAVSAVCALCIRSTPVRRRAGRRKRATETASAV